MEDLRLQLATANFIVHSVDGYFSLYHDVELRCDYVRDLANTIGCKTGLVSIVLNQDCTLIEKIAKLLEMWATFNIELP